MDGATKGGRGGLRHPLFWGALALLLLNDHVLKGAAILPGAITGKLSDFAGLIVAPVFVAALFRAKTPFARLASFALATAPFIAINVSPEAASGLERLVALVGLEWRIWCDPSDLVGLAALPIAYGILDAEGTLPGRRATEGAALVLSAFACMATSQPTPPPPGTRIVEIPPPDWSTATALHNGSVDDVDVRLRWVSARFECDRVRDNPGAYLSREAFGDGVTVTLDPGRNFPLSRATAGEALELGADWLPPRVGCDAVLVQRDGASDAVVFFGTAEGLVPRHSTELLPETVEVGVDGDPYGSGSVVVSLHRAGSVDDAGACPAIDAPPFAYSGERVELGTMATVLGTQLLRDGCFDVTFGIEPLDGEPATEPWHSYFCVPMWAFDLAVGDTVRFDEADTGNVTLTRLAAEARPESVLGVLTLGDRELGGGFLELGGASLGLSHRPGSACLGGISECGAYVAAVSVEVEGRAMYAGHEDTGVLLDGRRYHVAIGDATETVVGVNGCDSRERDEGLRANAVILIEEAE